MRPIELVWRTRHKIASNVAYIKNVVRGIRGRVDEAQRPCFSRSSADATNVVDCAQRVRGVADRNEARLAVDEALLLSVEAQRAVQIQRTCWSVDICKTYIYIYEKE